VQLRREYIDRLFVRLHGLYGLDFVKKYASGEFQDGQDLGLCNAKQVWAELLAGFDDHPEAIAYALDHVDHAYVPNAMQFRELCRQAPRKGAELPALERKFTPEELAANRARIQKMLQGLVNSSRMQGT
jgi:hypothetical protein